MLYPKEGGREWTIREGIFDDRRCSGVVLKFERVVGADGYEWLELYIQSPLIPGLARENSFRLDGTHNGGSTVQAVVGSDELPPLGPKIAVQLPWEDE